MKTLFYRRLWLLLALSLVAAPGYSAKLVDNEAVVRSHAVHPHIAVNQELTPGQVFSAALARAPERSLGEAYQQQADAHRLASRSLIAGRPRFNLSYWDDQVADNTGSQETEAGIEFDLWRRGQKGDALALAESFAVGAQAWRDYLKLTVAGRLREVLHRLDTANVKVRHSKEALADAEKLLAVSETRFNAGEIPHSAVMQTEALVLETRQQTLAQQAEKVEAERQYATLTGLQERPARFAESVPSRHRVDEQHPWLRVLLAERRQRAELLTQQRHQAAGNSALSLAARRQRSGDSEPDIDSVGVSLSIPFGGSRHTAAASSAAAVALSDADVRVQQVRLQLQQQRLQVEHELDVIDESITYAAAARDLSSRQWQLANKAFAVGESDIRATLLALQNYRSNQLQWQLLQLRRQALISSYRQTVGELL